ncbi:hypothetical protein HYX14_02740 [Candidatus Woesearchaeota archaeon]|nr:hypothetical protein [Candidatus Woesearchaeota archaeon]
MRKRLITLSKWLLVVLLLMIVVPILYPNPVLVWISNGIIFVVALAMVIALLRKRIQLIEK